MPIPEFQDLTSALRRARHSSVASTPCISESAMAAFVSGTVHGDARASVIAHLNECASCRAEFADVSSALADPAIAREVAALSQGERVAKPRRFGQRAAAAGLAAAALLFVVSRMLPVGSDDAEALRDHGINADAPVIIAPASTAHDTSEFRWSRVEGADRYRVTVFSPDGVVVWDAETADTSIMPPSPSPLHAGARYLWKVQARTAFERWAGSGLIEFTVRSAR